MKIFKLRVVLIIILLLIAGILAFTISSTYLNSLNAPTNDSRDLSGMNVESDEKYDNPNNTSVTPTSEVDSLEAESSVLDLKDTFQSYFTDAAGVDAQSGATKNTSIYGKNLSVIPTEVLVNKASVIGKNQNAEFMGIVINFKPMIIVTESKKETKVTFDLTAFNYAEGQYTIINTATKEIAASFTGNKGVHEVQFNTSKSGSYSIIKDNYTFGIIEVVDNLGSVDLEEVRKKYLY